MTQILQKQTSQTPVAARFRDTYAPTSRNMILLSLRGDLFSNQAIKSLGPTTPFFHLKKYGIFTQILQKRPSKTSAVARFRETYAPTSRKYVSTEPNAKLFN